MALDWSGNPKTRIISIIKILYSGTQCRSTGSIYVLSALVCTYSAICGYSCIYLLTVCKLMCALCFLPLVVLLLVIPFSMIRF